EVEGLLFSVEIGDDMRTYLMLQKCIDPSSGQGILLADIEYPLVDHHTVNIVPQSDRRVELRFLRSTIIALLLCQLCKLFGIYHIISPVFRIFVVCRNGQYGFGSVEELFTHIAK